MSTKIKLTKIDKARDLLLLESSRHKAARETLRQACAELESDLDVMEKERDEARREAEGLRERLCSRQRGTLGWPKFSWEGAGPRDDPRHDFPNGEFACACGAWHTKPVAPPSAEAPRCGEPEHLRYLESMLAAKNKWLKGLPTREEFDHLNTEFCSLVAGVDALSAKVDAVRDLALDAPQPLDRERLTVALLAAHADRSVPMALSGPHEGVALVVADHILARLEADRG